MANPIWNEKKKRWKLRQTISGKQRVFTSSKPGRNGKADVNKLRDAALDGESDKARWRLEKCWTEYLNEVKSLTSFENYHQREVYGRLYILPTLGKKRVGEIKLGDWQDCITNIKKPLSKKSLSNLRSTIINFCNFGHAHSMVSSVPTGLRLPKSAPVIGKEILQPDQIKRLFEPSTAWYIHAWRFMLVTGLRPGEVLGLQNSDVSNGVLTIRRSINWRNQLTSGKNDNAKRSIYLHSLALAILADQEYMVKSSGINFTHWIFPAHDGGAPSQQAAYRSFSLLLGGNVTPYCLRHSFISLLKHALPESMLKQIVGHSKDMDTLGVYGHKVSGEQEEAARLVDGALRKWIN